MIDLTPFKLDIDELIHLFTEWNCSTLSEMKRVWTEKKFSFIFEAKPSTNSAFFMQSLYAHSLSHVVSTEPLSRRLGGLFCLYCIFETQPYKPCFKIYLSLGELKSLISLVVDAKNNGICVVPALIKRMLDRDMFLFGFVDIIGGFVAQTVDKLADEYNRHSQSAYKTIFKNTDIELLQRYLHMDLGVELDLLAIKKMSAEYDEAKALAIREANGKVEFPDAQHIVESEKCLGESLNDVVVGWEMQKDAFYQQTGTSRPGLTASYDEFAEINRLLGI